MRAISTNAWRNNSLRRGLGSVLVAAMLGALAPTSGLIAGTAPIAHAAGALPEPVMTGYVPLEADATQKTMKNANSAADATLDFTVGITNAGAGAIIDYDHWEDGFEADLTNPVQSTTQVWGDGDPSNGDAQTYCGSVCAGDLLPAGAVFVLRNTIPTPRTTAIRWDGRDRVSSTRGFTITAGGFSTPLGSVLSASASAYDTSKWGVDYYIPVGEDMTPPSGTSDAFSTTSVQVMADQPGTVVAIDKDGNGTDDQTATLGEGEVMFVDGGVDRGAHVHSSKPVQVHVGAGDAGAMYELRWFTLFPTPALTSDYLNPVGSAVDNQRTITYLFNPNASAITVTPTCTGCAGTLSVPAKGGASFASPISQAVRFQSGGQPFVAVGAGGSESGAAPGSSGDGSSTYDWGFGLVPFKLLTSKAVLGWAPGNSTNPPNVSGDLDDDPIWISAIAATTIYIDYDGDPTTGALTSPCDGNYDESRSISAMQSERIFDATDGDMTGASVYTCDGTKLAGAWGEDAQNAPGGTPGFDAGYALIPSTAILVDKTAVLTADTNGDGRFGPGDVITYDVSIADAGALSFTNLNVADAIPAGTTYVAGSTTYDDGATTSPYPDDVTPAAATAYPFDEAGANLPTVNPGVTVHVRYSVLVDSPFPAGTSVTNSVVVDSDQSDGNDTVVTNLLTGDLSLTKGLTTTPTYIGQNATYLLTVHNAGPDGAPGVAVTDQLPAGLTYVSSSASQGSYDSSTGVWSVGTVANGADATLSLTATVAALSVTNSAEITGTLAADPDSTPANASTTEDDDASVALTVLPRADISLTKVLDTGPDASGNSTFTLTLANAGPSPSSGVVVTDYPPTGSSFVSATAQTSAAADGTFDGTTNTWTVPAVAAGGQAQIHVVYATPVAPGTNFAQVTASSVNDPDSAPDVAPLTAANPPDQDDEASAGIAASGDLQLTNQVTTPATSVGEVAAFTVTITNDGPTNTTGVMVTDLLPAGLQFVSSTPSVGTYDSSTGVWTIGALASGASVTLLINARVTVAGALQTTAEVTASTAADVDSTPNNHLATEDDQADAGVTTTGSTIGDTVWYDVDRDGTVDAGETLLANVGVGVRWAGPNGTFGDGDDVITNHTTDASGSWSATGLPLGDYRVTVDSATLPFGLTTASSDRDGTGSAGTTSFTLAGGQTLSDVDFAYVGSAAAGDTVYLDADGDHTFDAGEGISGAAVHLVWSGPDGALDAAPGGDDVTFSTTTSANGTYHFVDLPAGPFSIAIDASTLPTGLHGSVDPDGGNDDHAAVTLTVGQSRQDLDFGYTGTNSIGDAVYSDIDADGIQSSGEPGLGGVIIQLRRDVDLDGTYETLVGTTATAGTGTYLFDSLPGGHYRVDITTPTGLTLSTPATIAVDLTHGQAITTADFGLRPPPPAAPGTIGDLVWNDVDGDGVHDAGEMGIGGVSITLRLDTDGDGVGDTIVATQTTSTDGSYGFANLPAGAYDVIATAPAGFTSTTTKSFHVALAAAGSFDTADFGFTSGPVAPASIGDRVWNDVDADGVQDAGEGGVTAATVALRGDTDGDGTFETALATTQTDPSGAYAFTGVAPGRYLVTVTPTAGQNLTTSQSVVAVVGAGAAFDRADFGLTSAAVPTASIGDRVWLDTDRDSIQDPDEPGVNGVTVTLRRDSDHDGSFDAIVATTVTAADGGYTFPGLAPGSYLVGVTAPTGLATNRPSIVVDLAVGAHVTTADVGLAPPATIPYDVQIVKTIEGTVVTGSDMTWVLTVSNNSIWSTPAQMTVTDVLASGLIYRSATGTGWTCSATGQTVTCTGGGPLATGQSSTIRIITTVTLPGGAAIDNTASVSATGIELTMSNNASTAVGKVASLPPVVTTTTTTTTTVPVATPTTALPTPELTPLPVRLPTTGLDIQLWLVTGTGLLLSGLTILFTRRRLVPARRTSRS